MPQVSKSREEESLAGISTTQRFRPQPIRTLSTIRVVTGREQLLVREGVALLKRAQTSYPVSIVNLHASGNHLRSTFLSRYLNNL